MNDDLERELREVFDDRATEASTAARIPRHLVRRARRRQAVTVAVSLVTVIAVASLAFSGLRMLDTDGLPALPADVSPYDSGRYPVFDRDVRIESFDVQSPSDWYLVNQWPLGARLAMQSGLDASCGPVVEPSDSYALLGGCATPSASPSGVPETGPLPVLQLSNRDFGLNRPACGIGSIPPIEMTGDDVVVEILIAPAPAGSVTALVELRAPLGLRAQGEQRDVGVCGPGTYLEFETNGTPYLVWASFGPDTSDEDREVALGAISVVNEEAIGEPTSPSPAYVLTGTDTWRLELRPSTEGKNQNVELSLVGRYPGGSTGNFTVPAVPLEECCDYATAKDGPLSQNPVRFGAVTKEASAVELQPHEGEPIAGTLVPLPPSLSVYPFDLFFVDSPDDTEHHRVVALGLDEPSDAASTPESTPTPGATPSGSPASNELAWENDSGIVSATGRFLGSSWRVEQLDYRDGLRSDIGGDVQSYDQPAIGESLVLPIPGSRYQALLLVLTDPKVEKVEVTSEGSWAGRWMPSTTKDGKEARLWVIELPGAGIGTLSFDGTNVGTVEWPS